MIEQEKINGWTFEETVKTAENLMENEQNMFKWDVLRHLRDFAENFKEELEQYRALGTVEELRVARDKQVGKKPSKDEFDRYICPDCGWIVYTDEFGGRYLTHCENCGKKQDWSDEDE